MANKFPLVANVAQNKIEELSVGDNLDLSSCGIAINNSTGQAGQVIKSTGDGIEWGSVGDVTLTGSQVLFNKSIDGTRNTLTNIPNSALVNSSITINGEQLSLGASISGIVTVSGIQTLTNKTIDGSLNTLSNISNNSLINSSITINGQTVNLGGSVEISGFGGNVTTSGVQVLTNKTIDGSLNTLSNISNSSLVNNSITINGVNVTLGGSVTVGNVTTSGNQILTNKSIDASQNSIANIANSSLVYSNFTINGVNVTLGDTKTINPIIGLSNPPEYSNSTGTPGSMIYQSGYLYVCIDTNIWVRFAKDESFTFSP